MKNKLNFSIIIPSCNDLNYLKVLIHSLSNQNFEPNEIIIIDSSTNLNIQNFFENDYFNLNIIYQYKLCTIFLCKAKIESYN